MDSSEVHYLTYDPEEIFNEMHTAYIEAGGDALYPGDEKEMLLRAVQSVMVQAFAGVDNALRMATLRYATGEYLDMFGENRGCSRIQSEKATAAIQITFNATGVEKTFEAGTTVTADGNQLWELANDLTHSGVAQTITAEIVAVKAGTAGNTLTVGTQMQMMESGNAIASIYCTRASSGGNDAETDSAYRERIQEFGLSAVTTGPKERYEAVAKSASSRIVDARAVSSSAGNVNVYLVCSGTGDGTTILNAVRSALNDQTIRPLTDNVTVAHATTKAYLLDVQYVAPEGTDISAAVSAAVNYYLNWQNTKIGLAFNPDVLTVQLYQAGCQRVIYKNNSNFAGGTVQYTAINANEVCTGSVIVTEVSA